ncbi:thioredoxin family protein [bacterium]|nr:thioredoxin family protein [bacterium]MBU1065205.1 thioredoxin family protein [bacterium]MBU1633151.1 thioredoxin family protein [bacterium]MBU1872331.1 thioredoxin family protein [bacterium]
MLEIIVLGSGCPNCKKLEQLCYDVAAENNLDATIQKITDINKFADYGIYMTPGLVINGNVASSGKIPTKSTLTHWLTEANHA